MNYLEILSKKVDEISDDEVEAIFKIKDFDTALNVALVEEPFKVDKFDKSHAVTVCKLFLIDKISKEELRFFASVIENMYLANEISKPEIFKYFELFKISNETEFDRLDTLDSKIFVKNKFKEILNEEV